MKWNALVLASLLLTMVGCGKSGENQTVDGSNSTETQTANDKIRQKLVGKWQVGSVINESAVQHAIECAKEEPKQIENINKLVSVLRTVKMEVEFLDDGTMISSGEQIGESHGLWKVIEDRGEKIIIKTTEYQDEQQDVEREIELTLDGEDSFSVELDGAIPKIGAMQFKRLR